MKRIIPMLLCALLLWGCGGQAKDTAPADPEPAETAAPEAAEPETPAAEPETDEPVYDPIVFTTTDLEGEEWTEADLTGEITILNFWEFWCGPCVGEMPALQRLHEEYADQGVQIIGIFSDRSDMESVYAALDSAGVTYPILYYSDDFAPFQTGYVPTTVFLDREGRPVTGVVGAYEYEQWVAMLEELR